jgi:hypothetical protein
MANKNTSVFGIYPHQASVENGVDALRAAGFSNNDISVLFPQKQGTKDFATRRARKRPKVLPPAQEPGRCWAAVWDGSSVSALLQFRDLARLLPPVRLWRPWLAPESAERSAV